MADSPSSDLVADMNINDFADFVFQKNTTNKAIGLSLNGIENTKDLFCFCLDILCKGLVLLFGSGDRVCIQDLSFEDFGQVTEKMKCIGIKCKLETFDVETPPDTLIDLWTQNLLNVHRVRTSDDNLQLEDYNFDIQTNTLIYRIRFELVHNVDDASRRLL